MPVKSHGQSVGAGQKGHSRRVATLVAAEETEPTLDHQRIQEKVAELRLALQEAEVENLCEKPW